MDSEKRRGCSRGPRNKKRPLTLSSLGTPEQPSPRTAQAQDNSPTRLCIFHLRASAWHHAATLSLCQRPRLQKMAGWEAVEHFLPERCIVSLGRKRFIQVCRGLHSKNGI